MYDLRNTHAHATYVLKYKYVKYVCLFLYLNLINF